MRALILTALTALLAGCSATPGPASGETPDETAPSAWDAGDRIVLYETHPAPRVAAVQTCTEVGSEPTAFERNADLIPNGTGSIAIGVTNDDDAVGFQVGWRIDGGPVAWLATVAAGHEDFTVPVGADQTEDARSGLRWSFVYRYTLAGTGHDCYTGPVLASHRMLIEAVRAPMG